MASHRRFSGGIGAGLAAAALGLASLRAAPPPPTETIQPQALLNHLNAVIQWYRETEQGAQWIGQPSDTLYFDVERNTAAQVVQDAFVSAEQTAKLIPASAASKPGGPVGNREALAKLRTDTNARISQLQGEIDGLNRQAQQDGAADRALLDARRGVVQSELKMEQSTLKRIDDLDQFTATYTEDASTGILDQVNNLKRSVPDAFAAQNPNDQKGAPHAIGGANGGLISRAEALFSLVSGISGLDKLDRSTTALLAAADGLSEPLRNSMRAMLQEGQALSTQNRSSENASALEDAKNQIDDLNDQLEDLSDAVLPLSKERILLRESHANLQLWKQSLVHQRAAIVRGFLEHAAALLFFIIVIFFASEIARRATYKYVHEPRRRRQFLVLRRVAVGFIIALVVIFSFVSDFSSLATYVGLITAGVAVALQTVILSVCAYFMLSGRYGVKVGDRITVQGVTGEVIETGLVRFYLTELAGTGVDLHPTGRVVVFPNAALFQNSPFYKQLPGTNYTWHEAVVALNPAADTEAVEKKLLEVVGGVYTKYKSSLEAQHRSVERMIDLHLDVPEPVAQLRFTGDGLQLVLRYPVELRHADETDGLTIYKLVQAIRADPKLQEQVKGTPHLQTAVKV